MKIKNKKKKKRESKWGQFILVELDEEQKRLVDGDIYVNNMYQVGVRLVDTPFGMMTQLSIKRMDKSRIRNWGHLQRIKNELVGQYVEAVELSPTMDRLVDTGGQHYLWCLPEGQIFPFGFSGNMTVTPEELGEAENGTA